MQNKTIIVTNLTIFAIDYAFELLYNIIVSVGVSSWEIKGKHFKNLKRKRLKQNFKNKFQFKRRGK